MDVPFKKGMVFVLKSSIVPVCCLEASFLKIMFGATVSASMVLNRVLKFWYCHKYGREIQRFWSKIGNGFRKWAAQPHQIFLGVPLGYSEVVHK